MITCSIVPNNVCEWMYDKKFVMLLTSALKDEKHKDKYIETALEYVGGCHTILKDDCGCSLIELLAAAETLQASEIILPGETIAEIKDQVDCIIDLKQKCLFPGLKEVKLQAMCGANSLEEWLPKYRALQQIDEIDVVGLPKSLSIWCKDANRINALKDFLWERPETKPIHLLGFWYSIKELLELPVELIGKIRSADTTLFALNAIDNQSVLEDRRSRLDTNHEYKELFRENYDRVMNEYYNLLYDKADKEGYLGV